MRDARDHLPERCHFLRLDQLRLLHLQIFERLAQITGAQFDFLFQPDIGLLQLGVDAIQFTIALAQSQADPPEREQQRSEEHTSELQSLMRTSYSVFCLKTKKKDTTVQNY